MSERFRFLLFLLFSVTILWFTLLLLCLPQDDQFDDQLLAQANVDQVLQSGSLRKFDPPRSPNFMRYFHPRKLSLTETLFYQFNQDLSATSIKSSNNSVTKSQHEELALRLNTISNPTDQVVKNEGYKLFAFNLLSSNRIGLTRSLPDTRPVKCPRTLADVTGQASKQQASIIICYYNEAPSALLRTIYSIIQRTPTVLIREIIVVDDFSDEGYDVEHIQAHTKSLPHQDLIRFYRSTRREGLIRARLIGASHATGEVIVFLDSHVEANVGWLEPLLKLIGDNRTTVACPMIDLINAETMIYSASPMVRGGITWSLHFKWDSIPAGDLKTYDDFAKPVRSASMAGGLYAIDRSFFNHLGAYDSGMNLWGGENIELSFRTWMCGGRILVVPCSRLGHIFRKTRPYNPAPDEPDSLLYNSHRSARVWLGEEYLANFYRKCPDAKSLDSGDISERLQVRDRLKCHNFTWFLDNIYPDMKLAITDTFDHIIEEDEIEPKKNLFHVGHQRTNQVNDARLRRRRHHKLSQIYPAAANSDALDQFSRSGQGIDDSPHTQDAFHNNLQSASGSAVFLSKSQPIRGAPKIVSTFQIQLLDSNLCIESKTSFPAQEISRLVLNDCLPTMTITRDNSSPLVSKNANVSNMNSQPIPAPSQRKPIVNQLWSMTDLHDYRMGLDRCLDIMKNLPVLRKCNNMRTFQTWSHLNHTLGTYISNYSNGKMCLAVEKVRRGEPVIVTICDIEKSDSDNNLDTSSAVETNRQSRYKKRDHQLDSSEGFYPARDMAGSSWLTGSVQSAKLLHRNKHDQQPLASPYLSFRVSSLRQSWNLINV